LDAARLSYRYLKQYPEEKPFIQGDFQTGGYQTKDVDDKLWAAAEMWNVPGKRNIWMILSSKLPTCILWWKKIGTGVTYPIWVFSPIYYPKERARISISSKSYAKTTFEMC